MKTAVPKNLIQKAEKLISEVYSTQIVQLLKQKNNVKSDPSGAKSVENLYENEV